MIQHFFVQLSKLINHIASTRWQSLSRHKESRWLIQLIANPQRPKDHQPFTLLFFALLTGLLFLIFAITEYQHLDFPALNHAVFSLVQSLRTPFFDHFFTGVAVFSSPFFVMATGLLLAVGFFLQKKKNAAAHLLLITVFSMGAAGLFKTIIPVERPVGFMLLDNSSSFPSGHTVVSLAIYFFIAYLFRYLLPKAWSALPYVIASLLSALVVFSRLYLGAHWLNDVVGGALLAASLLLLCIISYQRHNKSLRASYQKSVLLLLVATLIPAIFFFPYDYQKTLLAHTPIVSQRITAIETWWRSPLSVAPLFRDNRLGIPFQPFNVQWQGSLNIIRKNLEARGWETIPKDKKLKDTLERFASLEAKYHLPILPWLYHNAAPVLMMVKPTHHQGDLIELRLWKSEIYFYGHQSLWIGATDIRIPPQKLLSLRQKARISLANNAGLTMLYLDTKFFQRKYVYAPIESLPKQMEHLAWDGKVLVIRAD